MRLKYSIVVLLIVVLSQLAFMEEIPTVIPDDSHFQLTYWDDPTGFLTITGVRGMRSSVLATRQGIFGLDVSPRFSVANDTFSLENINKYATDLDDALKDEIIGLAGEDGIFVQPFGLAGANLQFGIFGVGARVLVNGQGYLTQDLLELILKGNELNRVYNFDPNLRLAVLGDAKAQVAFRVPLFARVLGFEDLALGVAYHHIPAGAYAVADSELTYEAIFTEEEAKNEAKYTGNLFVSYTVEGSALDVGLLIRPVKNLYFAAAIDGLLGKVTWSDFRYVSMEELMNTDYTSLDNLKKLGEAVEGEVTQELPLTIKVGTRFDLFNWLKLYGEARQITLEDKTSYYTVSAGTDLTLLWVFPVKAGVSYDTRYNRMGYNIGAGLKLLFLEAGVEGYTRPVVSGDELGFGVTAKISF